MAHSTSYPQLQLDRQLCFPLYATTRAVTKQYNALLGDLGLTYPQYLVLLVLWDAEAPLAVSELGAELRLDSGTLTPLLKRLEAMGYVDRSRDAHDERRVLVQVTPEGAALRAKVADVPTRLFAAMGVSEAEARDLRDRLTALMANLDASVGLD